MKYLQCQCTQQAKSQCNEFSRCHNVYKYIVQNNLLWKFVECKNTATIWIDNDHKLYLLCRTLSFWPDDNMTGSISLIRIQCGNNFYFVSLDEDKRIQNKKHTNSV
jgi:hypothetical protein